MCYLLMDNEDNPLGSLSAHCPFLPRKNSPTDVHLTPSEAPLGELRPIQEGSRHPQGVLRRSATHCQAGGKQ